MKGQTYIIFAVVFAVIIAVFAVINVDAVEVNYLFGTGHAPLILVILFSVLMGAIITAAVGVLRLIRLQKELKAARKEINALKAGENLVLETAEQTTPTEKTEKNETVE
ncbi:LapA family protein [Gracilibacillus sp. HCP3S3_G5_1]|uniref:LapA family protein n=1 Tax=unclassified Gracilibacillus TaxID=2625209 RepID=UPI003F8C7239